MNHAMVSAESALSIDPGMAVMLLTVMVLLLLGVIWHHARKIRRLEQKLVSQHRFLRQELKMMSQGAIGVGIRVKHLEKQIKHQPSPFEQLLTQQTAEHPTTTAERQVAEVPQAMTRPERSRAERSLSDWMRDYQTPA